MDYYHFSCFFSLCFHHRLCMSLVQNTGGQRDWENKLLFRLDGMHKTITIEILIIICFLAMKKLNFFSSYCYSCRPSVCKPVRHNIHYIHASTFYLKKSLNSGSLLLLLFIQTTNQPTAKKTM